MSHPQDLPAVHPAPGPADSTSATATAPLPVPPRNLAEVEAALAPLRAALVEHDLYRRLGGASDLALFTEHHVFAVWDFMSLLKALQRELTCVTVPWTPVGSARVRRLVNEMVLAEESDRLPDGRVTSHFELYVRAMEDLGADTAPVRDFVDRIGRGEGVLEAVTQSGAPCHARSFLQGTWRIVKSRSLPMLAAAFVLGREDVIAPMFARIVDSVAARHPGARDLVLHFERHVPPGGDGHGAAKAMLEELLGDDPVAWADAYGAARASLKARLALWDGVAAQVGAPTAGARGC